METVRRVFAAYLGGGAPEDPARSPASSVKSILAPRRLSRSFANADTPGSRRDSASASASIGGKTRFARDAVAVAIGTKRGRESPAPRDATGDEEARRDKRARVGEDARGAETPRSTRVKRKRASGDEGDDDAPATHRRRTSSSVEAGAGVTPAFVAVNVLKTGRLDAFKRLTKFSSRVEAPVRPGTPTRRGLTLRGPRRGSAASARPVELDELEEDRAEREKLEATRAPALAAPSTSTTTTAATTKKKTEEPSIFGAALAEFKSTKTDDAAAKTAPADAKDAPPADAKNAPPADAKDAPPADAGAPATSTSTPAFSFTATASKPQASTPGFAFGASAAASASAPNPFSASAGPAAASPFAFSAGAGAGAAPTTAPTGQRRVVRARRPGARR
jgi:hypothetical protein